MRRGGKGDEASLCAVAVFLRVKLGLLALNCVFSVVFGAKSHLRQLLIIQSFIQEWYKSVFSLPRVFGDYTE